MTTQMAIPIVVVATGGMRITESTNGYGMPVQRSANGYGIPVVIVVSGGVPVIGSGNAPA